MSASSEARNAAIRLLARREHSVTELERKLAQRDHEADAVAEALAGLAAEGLQSNDRFAEAYVYSRVQKGYGPERIRAELRERGVSDSLAECYLQPIAGQWHERIEQVRQKRFGAAMPESFEERVKQSRFLQHRGFNGWQIQQAFRQDDRD